MGVAQKLKHEIVTIVSLTLYFLAWLSFLMLLKFLLLSDFQIEFTGFSIALVGALVLAKVVLILEYVPMGEWVRSKAAWVDVTLRTSLYIFGVFVVLLLEKGFEGRHEHGGFTAALTSMFESADIYHVWLNFICLSVALLSYNILSVVRKNLGKGALLSMFIRPLPDDGTAKNSISEGNQ